MNNITFMTKCREWIRTYPIVGSLIAASIYYILVNLIGTLMTALPDHTVVYYLQQFLFIGLTLVFVLFFGYGWVYKRKGFCKTLKILMLIVIIQGLLTVTTIYNAINNPESEWQGPLMIIIGIISLFEIGFSEESIFRGIVSNAVKDKYATDIKGVWKSVIVTGLIFGLVHMLNLLMGVSLTATFIQTVMATVVGMVYAAAYYRGKNIWALMFVHALTDTNSLFDSTFMTNVSEVTDINDLSMISLITVPFFLLFTAFLLRKKKIGEVFEDNQVQNQ